MYKFVCTSFVVQNAKAAKKQIDQKSSKLDAYRNEWLMIL